jgi:hypothetical protein
MRTLVTQLAKNATNNAKFIVKPEDVIRAGVLGLDSLGLKYAELSVVRAAFSHASASSLITALALAIVAMPCAYVLQWKMLYPNIGSAGDGQHENERVETSQTREV